MVSLTMGNGLFGNPPKNPIAPKPDLPNVEKIFFIGKDFNHAKDFLASIGLEYHYKWNYIHNVNGIENVSSATVYVCPHAEETKDFEAIMKRLQEGRFRLIFMMEVKTWEVQ